MTTKREKVQKALTSFMPVRNKLLDGIEGSCDLCHFRRNDRCVRFPPQALPGGAVWPRVKPEDWCGEFRSRAVGHQQQDVLDREAG